MRGSLAPGCFDLGTSLLNSSPMMSLGTGALKVSGKASIVIQATQGGIPGKGTTPKQPLTGTVTLEHGLVIKITLS